MNPIIPTTMNKYPKQFKSLLAGRRIPRGNPIAHLLPLAVVFVQKTKLSSRHTG